MPLSDGTKVAMHVDALAVLDDIRRTGQLIEEFRWLKKHGGSRVALERLRSEINKLKASQANLLESRGKGKDPHDAQHETLHASPSYRGDGLIITPRLRPDKLQQEGLETPMHVGCSPDVDRSSLTEKKGIIALHQNKYDNPDQDRERVYLKPLLSSTPPSQDYRRYCSVVLAVVLAEAHIRREIIHKYEKRRLKLINHFKEGCIIIALSNRPPYLHGVSGTPNSNAEPHREPYLLSEPHQERQTTSVRTSIIKHTHRTNSFSYFKQNELYNPPINSMQQENLWKTNFETTYESNAAEEIGHTKRKQKEWATKIAKEETTRQRAAEEEAARRKAAEEEAARRKAEEEEAARRKSEEEEAARRKAEEEEAVRRKAAEEEAARRMAEEEEAARWKAEEEAARRMAAEEQKANLRRERELMGSATTHCINGFAGNFLSECIVSAAGAFRTELDRRKAEEEEAARRKAEEEEAARRMAEEGRRSC
ncbi:kinetoplast DNA-associated protein, putative [Trypanosoma cruzi marinkellei]|uniref:Kinetoplast DNA-associated protein, putative n=1 Tax=Trypanosoma cruzi marinkellei TaxID=85056 RepID=K2NMN2_TRYCR|nr:kinetoplast DNA-associated protein, putative [Trypanosoma cruzi marinkellei]